MTSPSDRAGRRMTEVYLLVRGLWFKGTRHVCPCCGWSVRAFTMGGGSFRTRRAGYCPRCNSKARHRRVWLYLQGRSAFGAGPTRLLDVAPHHSLARALSRQPGVEYVGIDLESGPWVSGIADLTNLPMDEGTFDAVVCVHVLEHIDDDVTAMAEILRVLRPGGWSLINVPLDRGSPTYEDPAITTPGGRRAAFGEATHVRIYGVDLVDRLRSVGFQVEIDHGDAIEPSTIERFGLTSDESILFCTRPEVGTW
jgi:SAM-dependent methyltransferase